MRHRRGRARAGHLEFQISNFRFLKPVEFKLGRRRWENGSAQLCSQALCLDEMFPIPVPRSAVFHADSKRRREVGFTPELRALTKRAVEELRALFGQSQISNLQENRLNLLVLSEQSFSVFTLLLKHQRDAFGFTMRSRRSPRDRANCLLSFLYAMVRHDCLAALTSAGLDPFAGFLRADRRLPFTSSPPGRSGARACPDRSNTPCQRRLAAACRGPSTWPDRRSPGWCDLTPAVR